MASIATTEENNTNWVENHGYEGVNFDMGLLCGVWKVDDNLYLEIFEETNQEAIAKRNVGGATMNSETMTASNPNYKRLFRAKTISKSNNVVTDAADIRSMKYLEDNASIFLSWAWAETGRNQVNGGVLKHTCRSRDAKYEWVIKNLTPEGNISGYSWKCSYLGNSSMNFKPFEAVRLTGEDEAKFLNQQAETKAAQDFYLKICNKIPPIEEFKTLSGEQQGVVISRLRDLLDICNSYDNEKGGRSSDTDIAEEKLAKYRAAV